MSYTFYLFLHLAALIVFITSMCTILISNQKSKSANALFGASGLFVFIAGFGLAAKAGFTMLSFWLLAKLFIWLLLAALVPIVNKRLPEKKPLFFKVGVVLLLTAVFLVVYKP